MTGFSGAGGEAEEHTALHGKPPPDDKATSKRGPDRPVATHSRFAALECDDQVECDSRTAATPSERLTSSALQVDQATMPDGIWWLEHNQAELQRQGTDSVHMMPTHSPQRCGTTSTEEGSVSPPPS